MIMVLSCLDLVSVVANHPGILLYLICWLRGDYDLIPKITLYLESTSVLLEYSYLALLVMNIERYLGAYYPIFHRKSVTRRRLLALLATLLITTTVMSIISSNSMVISSAVFVTIFVALFLPPFLFVNFKLFVIAIKLNRKRAISPGRRTTVNLKGIPTGIWAVACLMVFSIPDGFYIVFSLAKKSTNTSLTLSYIWMFTCSTMNCTLNSLIFFWKNKVLCTEGKKMLKTLKNRLVES